MKLDQLLMNNVKKSSCDFLFDNFKKIVNELNFKDGMSGVFRQGENYDGELWIQIIFDNSCELTIWDNNDFTFKLHNKDGDDSIYATDYENLLKFMERKGIRKDKECEYKDVELYIVDFER